MLRLHWRPNSIGKAAVYHDVRFPDMGVLKLELWEPEDDFHEFANAIAFELQLRAFSIQPKKPQCLGNLTFQKHAGRSTVFDFWLIPGHWGAKSWECSEIRKNQLPKPE